MDPRSRHAHVSSGTGAAEDTEAGVEPQWLSADERAAWLAVAAIMISLPAALDVRLQREAGLTFFEYMVLSVLSERGDRTMQMSEIAAGVSASLSRLSHATSRLERRGLLYRSRIPGSGRRTTATLTEDGYRAVVAAAPGHVSAVRELLMNDLKRSDLAVLTRIGTAVARRVNPDRPFFHGAKTPAE